MRHLTKKILKTLALVVLTLAMTLPAIPTANAGIVPEAFKPWSAKGSLTSYHLRGRLWGEGAKPPKSVTQHAHRWACNLLMAGAVAYGATYMMTGKGFFSFNAAADHYFNSVPEQFGEVSDGVVGVINSRCIDDGTCNFQAGYDDYEYLAILMRDALNNNELGINQPFQIMPLIRAYGLAHENPDRSYVGDLIRSMDVQGFQARLPEDGLIGIPRSKEEVGRLIDAALREVDFQNMLMHTLITDLSSAYHPARESYFQKSSELQTARAELTSLRNDSGSSNGAIRAQTRVVEALEAEIELLSQQLNAAEETIRREISETLGVDVNLAAVRSMLTSPVGSSLLRHLVAVASFKNYVETIRSQMQDIVSQPTEDPLVMESRMQQMRSYIGTYALTTRIMAVAIEDYITSNQRVHTYFDTLIADAESLIGQMERQNSGFNQPLSEASRVQYEKNLSDIEVQRDVIRIARDYQTLLTERNANLSVRYNEMIDLFGTLARDVALASNVADLIKTIEAMETTAAAMQSVLDSNPENFFSLAHYTEGLQSDYSAEALEVFERQIRTDVRFQ